jgi:hypothetical protein
LKQLAEQQSLSCVQACSLAFAHWLPSAQHTVPAGQLPALHWHCPWALQLVPAGQMRHCTPPVAPQKRGSPVMHCPGWPGPCSQQPSGQEIASQTQRPLTQWLPPSSVRHDWQTAPLMPHTPLAVPGWQKSFASQQPAQQAPPGP